LSKSASLAMMLQFSCKARHRHPAGYTTRSGRRDNACNRGIPREGVTARSVPPRPGDEWPAGRRYGRHPPGDGDGHAVNSPADTACARIPPCRSGHRLRGSDITSGQIWPSPAGRPWQSAQPFTALLSLKIRTMAQAPAGHSVLAQRLLYRGVEGVCDMRFFSPDLSGPVPGFQGKDGEGSH